MIVLYFYNRITHPKEEHVNTVIHLEKYLYATKEQGMILRPNKGKSFEVWVDADFSGNWNNTTDTSNC